MDEQNTQAPVEEQTELPLEAPQAQGTSDMPAPAENPPGTWNIWKPVDQEFSLERDFKAIADKLGQPIESVTFDLVQVEENGMDGKRLSGHIST